MAQGSAGVKAREIDLSGPVTRTPTGVPAGVIGTSLRGPAFVPVTVGNMDDFFAKFGQTDGKKFGPLAANEWLRNAGSLTYLRVLGVGDGKARTEDGSVNKAGFVVGTDVPTSSDSSSTGYMANAHANVGGDEGRTYFLGAFMDDASGSSFLSSAGLSTWTKVGSAFQQGVWCRYGLDDTNGTTGVSNTDYDYGVHVNNFKYSSVLHKSLIGDDFLAVDGDVIMAFKATFSTELPGDSEMLLKFDLGTSDSFTAGTASGPSWTGGQGSASSGGATAAGNLMIRLNKTSGLKLDQYNGSSYDTTDFESFSGAPVAAKWSTSLDKSSIVWINKTKLASWVAGLSPIPFTMSSLKDVTKVIFTPADLSPTNKPWPEVYVEWNTSVFAMPVIRGVIMAASGVLLKLAEDSVVSAPASSVVGVDGGSGVVGVSVGHVDLSGDKQEFKLLLNGHKGLDVRYPNVLPVSFDVTSPNYFANVLNSDPIKTNEAGHCLYAHWDIHGSLAAVTGSGRFNVASNPGVEPAAFLLTGSADRDSSDANKPNYESFEDRFSHAKTPWVVSQKFAGKPLNLFRLHALDAGADIANLYKFSIENITPASETDSYQYGTFDLVIRKWSDRDGELLPLEQFRGVNLDPSSDKYISKVVGDAHVFFDFERDDSEQKIVMDGNYAANSNLVRVEVSADVEGGFMDARALPMGFRGIDHLVTSGTDPLRHDSADGMLMLGGASLDGVVTPPLPMRMTVKENVEPKAQANSRLYWGVQFEHVTDITKPNASKKKNDSLVSYTKYFPSYDADNVSFMVGDNVGQADSEEMGVLDSDKFCNNLFTLENVMVKEAAGGKADSGKWADAVYSRSGALVEGLRSLRVSDLSINENRRFAKFTMIMQGGFNGVNIFDNDSIEMNNAAVSTDIEHDATRGGEDGPTAKAYIKALDVMKNVVNVDVQLLTIPGIREEVITNMASEAVRDRFDALYLMDISEKDNLGNEVKNSSQNPSVANTANQFQARSIDNSFVAAYYPDVIVRDPVTFTNVVVPPSVAVLGALALNDRVAHPWFAPAGMTRGALDSVLDVKVKLNQSNLDTLYDVNINPLVSPRSGDGIKVWGQKTLQAGNSALNRVNVRRLLIEIRRQVRDIAQTILFEPNRAATLARFTAAVTPRLARIQALAGLQRFRVIIDSSTTTQQDVENNTIRGKIFVQPTKSVEFVSLDFVVSNTAAQ